MSSRLVVVDTKRSRRERALARRELMTLSKTRLGGEEDLAPIRGSSAISLLTHLSEVSWSLTGQPWPNYDRSSIPFRFVPTSSR